MRVLLNDGMDDEGVELLTEAGIEVDLNKRPSERLVEEVGSFDALVVRSATKVTRQVIEAGARGNLKAIGRAGVGYDNIDVQAASESGIVVKFAPHGNTNATAELTLALMLAVSRNIPQAHHSLKDKTWRKKGLRGVELYSKTLGLIGCGRIGQRVADLAHGFGMRILGYDLCPYPETRIEFVDKRDLLSRSDYISIHTGGRDLIVGGEDLELMKPTAYLVNASRACNVDQGALYEALKAGEIAGAALDVHAEEPKEEKTFESRFLELDNVVLTSHLGASTDEARTKTAVEMANVIVDYLLQGDFSNAVNAGERIDSEEKKVYPVFFYHEDVPGVFARIDTILGEAGINIRETSSRQLGGGGVAMTIYLVHQEVPPGIIEKLRAIENVSLVKK